MLFVILAFLLVATPSINAGWLDGHVMYIPAREVKPRFLSRNNYWDWR